MDSAMHAVNLRQGVLLTLILAGLALAQQPDSTLASLRVETPFEGLTVRVDGRPVGKTPLETCRVSPGIRTITVSAPDSLDWLSRPFIQTLDAKAGAERILHVQFWRRAWVTSEPPGALVMAADTVVGRTPLLVSFPYDEKVQFRMSFPGYTTLTVTPSGRGDVHGALSPLSSPSDLGIRQPEVSTRRLIWGTALAVALGAAGYWCQSEADEAYKDYLSTGHPGRMNDAFHRAETYDRWSGALYVAGEVTLGMTLYFSLKGLWR